ncbi:MAG TPA: AtpZ/AtpI family protein [Anaeromyxobacteraceae bacterium]|nr:AtpZ/AtpI family protein [Anaeromyxobacteraceae bacterium]
MASPDDREAPGKDGKGLSGLADAYQKAAPLLGASTTLVAAVGGGAALGYWVDHKVGNRTPWFLIAGSILGMLGGFVSFFRTVMGKRKP